MRWIAITVIAAAVCPALNVFAQSDSTEVALGEVTVTAKAPVTLLPLTVSTIDRGEIEKSAETNLMPILENRVPGMFVTQRGVGGYGVAGGAAGGVSIRGVGGIGRVLFMIDGQPQWAGIFGHALPDTYVAEDIAKVEIVRGPSSLLYGSGAMGGSVNIITRHATADGVRGSARAEWGSYGTMKYGANVGYRHHKLNTFLSATYERSDGHRRNMQYWLANQFASVSYDFSSHWKAGANLMLTESTPHNPGEVDSPLLDMWTHIFRGTAAVSVSNDYAVSSGGLQAYLNWGRHKINDGHAPDAAPRQYLFRSNDYNAGVTAYQTLHPWQDNNLSLGIDFKHWGGKAWNDSIDSKPDKQLVDKSENEIAGYAMMQQGFLRNMINVNAGIRYEHSSQFGSQWVPQAGFVAHFIAGNTLKFSWGKGFRSPNLRELYMYGAANPDLKPEEMWNYEVEIRQRFLGGKLTAGVSLYFIDGKNLIQQVRIDSKPKNVNTGSFINKGFEVDATYNINSQWRLTANYSFLHTNAIILNSPKHKLFGAVDYHPGNWEFSLESLSILGLVISDDNNAPKENYSLLNARVAYNLDVIKALPIKIFCKADNLTNTKYETYEGFPMPGITVMAGFRINF